MYFNSREEAGQQLVPLLSNLQGTDVVVVALSEASVPVAVPIAKALHAQLSVLVSRPVNLPSSTTETLGAITQDGTFVVSDEYSASEAEEMEQEFHGFIEEEKLRQMHIINQLMGHAGVVSPNSLRGHKVLAVSDGLGGISSLDALNSFLKPIHISRLIAAVPVASVEAVDRLHIMFDEIHCLNVTANYLATDHYYNDQPPPAEEEVERLLRENQPAAPTV